MMTRRRAAARIILLDRSLRVLLFKASFASVMDPTDEATGRAFWLTPGGGLKYGETFEEAAVRELREETGIEDAEFLTLVWFRKHLLLSGDRGEPLEVYEHFFLARIDEPSISVRNQTASEKGIIKAYRWWTIDDIKRSAELFVPRNLGELLEPIGRGEIPQSPFWIGR